MTPEEQYERWKLAERLYGARYHRYPCALLEDARPSTQEAWLRVADEAIRALAGDTTGRTT